MSVRPQSPSRSNHGTRIGVPALYLPANGRRTSCPVNAARKRNHPPPPAPPAANPPPANPPRPAAAAAVARPNAVPAVETQPARVHQYHNNETSSQNEGQRHPCTSLGHTAQSQCQRSFNFTFTVAIALSIGPRGSCSNLCLYRFVRWDATHAFSADGKSSCRREKYCGFDGCTSSSPTRQTAAAQTRSTDSPIPGRGIGSARVRVTCDTEVSPLVSYWNDPRSGRDVAFRSPFLTYPAQSTATNAKTRYLSFEPDRGGWNNIRMEFEIMVVLAAATGRVLILPPEYPVYLLQNDTGSKHRGLQDFFQYGGGAASDKNGFDDVVDAITMPDFFHREILEKKSYALPLDETNRTKVLNSIHKCNYRAKDSKSCIYLFDHMANIADFVPDWQGEENCLIMDDSNWFQDSLGLDVQDAEQHQNILDFCNGRSPVYYNQHIHDAPLVHFRSHLKNTRLLVHFYAFIYFTNPSIGNHYKRLVRDRVRYPDAVFCAAGKVVKALNEEFGSYSSMHIRRGDFQWPKMRISAEEWLANTRHIFDDGEVIYISTDETDMSFFEPLAGRYRLKFLSDYGELAGLDRLDPNFVGMIDVVIASRGREFVGTYFSSFSAFIGRLRGYHGMSGRKMHYGHVKHMNETHAWVNPHASYSAREFPTGWVAIDGDTEPTEKDFF